MKTKTKIWWRNFQGTEPWLEIQDVLARHGMSMRVRYDKTQDNKIAVDVHVYEIK